MKRAIQTLSILIFLHLLGCTGCCEEYQCSYGELESIEFRAFNNAGESPVEVHSDTLPALAFMLQVTFRGTKMDCPENAEMRLNPFISSAYAYKCEGPVFQSPDTIVSMIITSNQAFNQNYPAGEDLTGLFVTKREAFPYSAAGWVPDLERNYYLFSKPEAALTHRFFIEMKLSDGRIFTDSTDLITLAL
jgi:hypothetical protein